MQIYRMGKTFAAALLLYSTLFNATAFAQDASSPFTIGEQLEIRSDILDAQRPLISREHLGAVSDQLRLL